MRKQMDHDAVPVVSHGMRQHHRGRRRLLERAQIQAWNIFLFESVVEADSHGKKFTLFAEGNDRRSNPGILPRTCLRAVFDRASDNQGRLHTVRSEQTVQRLFDPAPTRAVFLAVAALLENFKDPQRKGPLLVVPRS